MAKVLTQRGVESAKPRPGRYGRNDGIVPGLRLIVYPTGAKAFALFTRVNGRLINHRIGDATILSLAQARDNAKRQLALIADGGDPREVRKARAVVDQETVETVRACSSIVTRGRSCAPGGRFSGGSNARYFRTGAGARSARSRGAMSSRCSMRSSIVACPSRPTGR